jgi:hypothetical protein
MLMVGMVVFAKYLIIGGVRFDMRSEWFRPVVTTLVIIAIAVIMGGSSLLGGPC